MTDEELDAQVVRLRELAMYYDVATEVGDAITTLRAQLAEARAELVRRVDMHECAMAERDDATLYSDEQRARADRTEAALAAQIEVDAGIACGKCGASRAAWLKCSRIICLGGDVFGNQPRDRTALDRMLAEAKAEALQGPWSDKPDGLTDAVHKAHPVFTKKYDTYTYALELVSNRHSKGALVALVNYLLQQSDEAREKALREAADELRGQGYGAAVRAILALIENPNAR